MIRLKRLLSVALLLSARRRLRAHDLSAEFGVSLRTIYRDVRALQETGFPIVGTAGDGYRLPSTTHLRPLAVNPEEAEALAIGARLFDALVDSPLKSRVQSAMAKLEAVLTPEAIQRVTAIRDRIFVEPRSHVSGPLAGLLQAVNERRVVAIIYDGIARGAITRRRIEPIGLVRYANVWLVPAYCRLRRDLRVFRADRIVEARVTQEAFELRAGLTLQDYLQRCQEEVCRPEHKTS